MIDLMFVWLRYYRSFFFIRRDRGRSNQLRLCTDLEPFELRLRPQSLAYDHLGFPGS